jgi:hypothetical protein
MPPRVWRSDEVTELAHHPNHPVVPAARTLGWSDLDRFPPGNHGSESGHRSGPADHDREATGLFLKFANWISEAMGRPVNIAFWFVLVVAWTLIFALGGPHLASGTWLPAWFTSLGYNFPLNLVTTVAELFIGFLVAAAAAGAVPGLMSAAARSGWRGSTSFRAPVVTSP